MSSFDGVLEGNALEPDPHYNEHLQGVCLDKGSAAWQMAAPNATKMNEQVMERWERWRSEVIFFVLFYNIFIFLILGGFANATRVNNKYIGTERRVGHWGAWREVSKESVKNYAKNASYFIFT